MSGWWCYVNPINPINEGCPHGMGGPRSDYYEGWFSELQNKYFEVDKKVIDKIERKYDLEQIYALNMDIYNEILKLLEVPFKYTPTEYIKQNKCVMPGLWLLVPDEWERK